MFDYLDWRGDLSFESDPLNAIDLLILATLSYCPMERLHGVFISSTPIQLTAELYPPDAAFRNDSEKQRCQLWKAASESERFGKMQVQAFAYHFDPAEEKQFSAVLFQLDENTAAAAFRGTDSTVVGWKEDFNMGFESPVPAQTDAVEFLTEAARRYDRLYTCGHSKGGNLALYAAVRADASVRAKVQGVYSFDGPGLDDQTADSPEYEEISSRIHSFVPESSIVGMLLDYHNEYTIVDSDGVGILQHNPFLWHIRGPRFQTRASLTCSGRYADRTLHDFLAQCTPEERQVMVETLFELVAATGAQRVKEIPVGLLKNFGAVRETLKKVPEQDQLVLKKVFRTLAQAGGSNLDALLGTSESGESPTIGQ